MAKTAKKSKKKYNDRYASFQTDRKVGEEFIKRVKGRGLARYLCTTRALRYVMRLPEQQFDAIILAGIE